MVNIPNTGLHHNFYHEKLQPIWGNIAKNNINLCFILEPEILVIRNIKSWIRRYDWLLENLEFGVLIACFFETASRVLLPTNQNIVYEIQDNQSIAWSTAMSMSSRGCSNFCIFLQAELQVPYISGNTAANFQRKIMTVTPRQMPFYVRT